jgi:adenine-specific DNA-methyltransferase
LRKMPHQNTAPLIYPGHLRAGGVRWPIPDYKKPNALLDDDTTAKLLLPAGTYVLVKRFSVKEEVRRIVACVFRPEDAPYPRVGFENHLNVFHSNDQGLDPILALGLALWLNSTVLDLHFRQFSGHTQVNATDLRSLRYPALEQLRSLGEAIAKGPWPDQEEIDGLVERFVLNGDSSSGERMIVDSSSSRPRAE